CFWNSTSVHDMNSFSILVPSILVLLLLACVECQLTFSPDWGKRSIGTSGANNGAFFDSQSGNCKTSNEMLLEIFRFVQNEAQLFLDCKHRE
ncbi:hypothetical protein DOY81_003427, partial [Sarcophaga bullata]